MQSGPRTRMQGLFDVICSLYSGNAGMSTSTDLSFWLPQCAFFSRTSNCDLFLAVIDACSVFARVTKYLTDEVLSDLVPTNILLLSQQTIAFIHGCFYSLHCQDHPNDTPLQMHHNLLMSICINWFDHLSVSLLRLIFFSNRSPSYWSPDLLGIQLQICELFIRCGESTY